MDLNDSMILENKFKSNHHVFSEINLFHHNKDEIDDILFDIDIEKALE